jgi:uncharacterized protein (TIGR02145 family)
MIAKTLPYLLIYAALAFIISCSGGDGGDTVETKYDYCITADNICLEGPFTANTCFGQPSNNCPYGNSSSSGGVSPSLSSSSGISSSSAASSSSSIISSSSIGSSSSIASSSSDGGSSSSSSYDSSSSVGSSSSIAGLSSSVTNVNNETFLDSRDNNTYKWVEIGDQIWMGENLNYGAEGSKCYGEGGKVYDKNYEEITLSSSEIQTNCDRYGRLYDWATAMEACPYGWHLPSNAEWEKLLRHVDGTNGTESPYNSPMAGKLLKATSGWNDKPGGTSGNGTDAFGFSALPGGSGSPPGSYGSSNYSFSNVGDTGYWWSSSDYNISFAYYRYIIYHDYAHHNGSNQDGGLFSVRCLKD